MKNESDYHSNGQRGGSPLTSARTVGWFFCSFARYSRDLEEICKALSQGFQHPSALEPGKYVCTKYIENGFVGSLADASRVEEWHEHLQGSM